MSSIAETVLQECRTWAMGVLGLTAPDAVILAQRGPEPGPFPLPPVLVLDLGTISAPMGTVEWTPAAAAYATIGRRTATLSVTGYGAETADWIEELSLRVEDALPGIAVVPTGETIDVSALQETGFQETYAREFTVHYTVRTERPATAATTFVTTQVINGNP